MCGLYDENVSITVVVITVSAVTVAIGAAVVVEI